MNTRLRDEILRRQRRNAKRLKQTGGDDGVPVLDAGAATYEMSSRICATSAGGVRLAHDLAHAVGLPQAIDERLDVLKIHRPYHESDHVLALAYNLLAGGSCIEDLELRRSDDAFLNMLGVDRIPDPTTAGDFCRRFGTKQDIDASSARGHTGPDPSIRRARWLPGLWNRLRWQTRELSPFRLQPEILPWSSNWRSRCAAS